MRQLAILTTFCLVAIGFAGGCGGGSAPETYPVNGKVTVDGKPLEAGSITFHPDPPGSSPGTSMMVNMGTYATSVAAGKYKVTIEPPVIDAPAQKYDPKYSDKDKTPLSYTVERNTKGSVFDVDLK